MKPAAEPAVVPAEPAKSASPASAASSPPRRVGRGTVALRAAFAGVYLALQIGLLATSARRPDGVFSFQMFNESSRMNIELYRTVRTRSGRERRLPVKEGRWTARDRAGVKREFSWHDRVRDRTLRVLGRSVHAPYGLDGQLFRLRAALDDVAAHIPDDAETTSLIARVAGSRNGREPEWFEYVARREPRR